MNEILPIKIRKAGSEDIDYITSTWLRSVYDYQKRDMKKDVFFPNHNRLIKERLPFLKCLVACNPEDENQIYGYVVYNNPKTLHFAYTKSYYRKLSVFKKLMDEAQLSGGETVSVTHKAQSFKVLESKMPIIFNPYLFLEVKQ